MIDSRRHPQALPTQDRPIGCDTEPPLRAPRPSERSTARCQRRTRPAPYDGDRGSGRNGDGPDRRDLDRVW